VDGDRVTGTGSTGDLKQALTGRRDATFVWVCNLEAENQWAVGHTGMPAVRLSATDGIVRHMEELGTLLADPGDVLLLGRPLDEDYRRYAEDIGFAIASRLVADAPDTSTSEAVMASPSVLARLKELAADDAYLMPMGCTVREQRIADATGLTLAAPPADVCERVNSKAYGRRLVERLGLRAIPGFCCAGAGELRDALDTVVSRYGQAIIKDSYGVSGKGLVVVDGPRKAERVMRMVDARTRRTGDPELDVVVERLLDKRFDLNYQFTIDRGGTVRLDFIKQALVRGGVHSGHLMPAELTAGQRAEIADAADRIGAALHADGFFGVVGVDALLADDGLVYPVVEINARLNMSTFQQRVTERFHGPGGCALARHYTLRATRPLPFAEVRDALGEPVTAPEVDDGAVITCFGTLNAQAADDGTEFEGRLYTVLFAADRDALRRLDRGLTEKLGRLDGVASTS
jgi:hypothetical protein